jgi:hypothetical protein
VELPTANTPFNPIFQQAPPYSTTFTRLPTHNLSHPSSESNNILATPVAAVGSSGESSRPQIYLVNQPLDVPAGFPTSFMVALEGEVPQSLNGTRGNWGPSSTRKGIEPFTLGRRFIKKCGKGKEKAS